ncbi:MAG: acyl-CoA dehydrogenase family protein [Sphingomicrobium sp.]
MANHASPALHASGTDGDFLSKIRQVVDEVARPHAEEVDREARFPKECIDALRQMGALSAFLTPSLGGRAVSFSAIAEACFVLGRGCSASAMVFAMHQIQVITLSRHASDQPYFNAYLRRLAEGQRLIASVTSEVGNGGDLSRSNVALTPDGDEGGDEFVFSKIAPTVSYGIYADDLLTTLRRGPGAEAGDQVLVLTHSDHATLDEQGTWDPLGMRGTCSPGFQISARLHADQVVAEPFARIAPQSMVPISHILWSHVWHGIATDAFDRARAFVRAQAKQSPGNTPQTAIKLSKLMAKLQSLRSEVRGALGEFLEQYEDRDKLMTFASVLRFNSLKLASSELTVRVCRDALELIGILGYQNNSKFSVGRHLRDALSAPLMIANERIHSTNAGLLLVAKEV